jgi:hypothetical protein
VRVIFAGQDSDEAGLDAMTPLIQATASGSLPDGVHYLLPLPPGIASDALELFGFWTYEFRVGHSKLWSTAQGRFGRPLRVTGIQHPPPHLSCTVWRKEAGVSVTAPYATTLLDGQPAIDLRRGDPQTALWCCRDRSGLSVSRSRSRRQVPPWRHRRIRWAPSLASAASCAPRL